jgi:uncharacterized protein
MQILQDKGHKTMHLTETAARSAMLAAQGLLTAPSTPASKGALLDSIQQMGYLQIDTIQAVRRSQYLVLWSRLGDFDPGWLDELHAEAQLFEYYAHALCYLPIEDYPIFRGRMLNDQRTNNWWKDWADAHPEVIQHVRSVIEEKGAVSSADFDSPRIPDGWGDVKQEKRALSHLFATGELMVAYREKFRRYFDLRERVLPDWDDALALDSETNQYRLLVKAVKALGVAREDWVAPYYSLLKTGIPAVLERLAAQDQIERVEVDGWNLPAYIHPENKILINAAAQGKLVPTHTTLLSPFDPLVSDRERALALFGFDYRMESFLPAKDRQYGYFCLPILHQGKLVGRLDPKAHRREKRMEIKKIFIEPGVAIDDRLSNALKKTLSDFSRWHEMTTCEITETDPPALLEVLS